MRSIAIILCSAALAASAQAPQTPAPHPEAAVTVSVPRPLLPDAFAGWTSGESPKPVTDPAQIDSSNAAALKEYGFLNGMVATYKRESQTLTVHALRFNDLSGAYGAYSFYRGTGWPKEDVGSGAASNRNRVVFWSGNIVVDVTFSRISPESGSELRDLAGQLPQLQGAKAMAPPILANLPQKSLDAQSTHYALGSVGYAGSGGVLPPDLVGFDRGAEAVTANYSLTSGPAVLTLIDYPTPQLAAAQEAKIRAYILAGNKALPQFPKPLADSDQASLEVRRSGPIVALISGDAIPEQSHRLLETVHYESEFVAIPQPVESEVAKTGRFLLGVAMLVIIGASASILLGFFLGGGRVLYRIARGKPASSVYETEFISLNLRQWPLGESLLEVVAVSPASDEAHTRASGR